MQQSNCLTEINHSTTDITFKLFVPDIVQNVKNPMLVTYSRYITEVWLYNQN